MTVGQRIKKLRKAKGWSQRDLAKRVGISTPFICQIENNSRSFSMQKLIKFAEVLGVTTECLLDLKPEQPSPYSQP